MTLEAAPQDILQPHRYYDFLWRLGLHLNLGKLKGNLSYAGRKDQNAILWFSRSF